MGKESFIHFFVEVFVLVSYRAIMFWERKYKIELLKGSRKVANVSTVPSTHALNLLSLVVPLVITKNRNLWPVPIF